MRQNLKRTDYEIKKASYNISKLIGMTQIAVLDPNVYRTVDLGINIPFFCKVLLTGKKVPFVLQFKYGEDALKNNLNINGLLIFYGSFVH